MRHSFNPTWSRIMGIHRFTYDMLSRQVMLQATMLARDSVRRCMLRRIDPQIASLMKGTFWEPAMAVDPVPHLEGLGFNKEDMLHRLGQAFQQALREQLQREDAATGPELHSTDPDTLLGAEPSTDATRAYHLKLVRQLTAMVSGASSRELMRLWMSLDQQAPGQPLHYRLRPVVFCAAWFQALAQVLPEYKAHLAAFILLGPAFSSELLDHYRQYAGMAEEWSQEHSTFNLRQAPSSIARIVQTHIPRVAARRSSLLNEAVI
jgi:hypothetical protein